MTARDVEAPAPREAWTSGIPRALGAALVWTAIDVARSAVPIVQGLFALLGSTSLILGALVVGIRRARPFGDGARAAFAGAAMSALPLLVVAAVLQKTTHHRALGGVTFAFVALFVVAGCIVVAARLLQLATRGGRVGFVARVALGVLVVPCVAVAASLLPVLRAPSAAPLVPALADGALGIALLSAALFVPSSVLRAVPARVSAVAWVAAVTVGIAVSAASPSVRAALSARVPVAFALGAGWGE
jgi:hypothetical protein